MIYLDNSAGTKPYSQVKDIINKVCEYHWGNPSAANSLGDDARQIIQTATEIVAKDINCKEDEIIWTSSATEANNFALCGCWVGGDVITSELEHQSIYSICNGFWLLDERTITNDQFGNINLDSLDSVLDRNPDARLVSIGFANSEIGVIQDIKAISNIVHKHGGILHVDATQMYPEGSINVKDLGIDMMSVSGQKLGCVKGIGFLYVKDGIKLDPIIYGTQQNGRRGSTLPTHLIAALGESIRVTREYYQYFHIRELRDLLLDKLLKIDGVHLNGPDINENRLENNISLTIDGVDADTLVTLCDMQGVIIGKGSACHSYNPEPSRTLKAIGLTDEEALSTIRVTLGWTNTKDEISQAADIIANLVEQIRSMK